MKQILQRFSRIKRSVWFVGLVLMLLPETGWGQVNENFNTWTGSTSYGTYTFNGFRITRGLREATAANVIGGSGSAVRLENSGTPNIEYIGSDGNGKDGGVGNISFYYRHWDGAPALNFTVDVNINGAGYVTIGTITNFASTSYSLFTYDLNNPADNIKVRVITNGAERLIIDDFAISNFSGPTVSVPTLSSPTKAAVTISSATLGATIVSDGGATITASGIAYGTAANPTAPTASSGATSGSFTVNVDSLVPNSIYYYRGFATNSAGTGYSEDSTLVTLPEAPLAAIPTIISPNAFVATWSNVDGSAAETYALDVSTDNSFNNFTVLQNQSSGTATSFNVTGLAVATTYYYRVRTMNASGPGAYSNVVTVTTSSSAVLPTVDNLAVSALTATTATLHAEVLNNGGAPVTATGFYYGTSASPTTNDTPAGSGSGTFSAPISGLLPNTTYYYRAYAENAVGRAYTTDGTFTTSPEAPVATAGTNVGAADFTANWNAVTGATAYRLDVSESNGFVTFVPSFQDLNVGNVTSYAVTGLQSGTTYYYRVRAVNAAASVSAHSNTETVTTSGPCIPKRLFFQGFEANNNWPVVSASQFSISSATGSGDTPSGQRILNGTKSWQTSNKTNLLELAAVNVANFTGKKIRIRLSSTATTGTNGAEASDYVKAFVSVNGAAFPANADVTVTGATNIRYGYNGTAIASTSAGTPITVASSSSATLANQYATMEITIPDNTTTVALKLEAKNNDGAEIWNVDDIEVMGCEIVNCNEPALAASNATVTPGATTAQFNWTNGSGTNRQVIVSTAVLTAAELPLDGNLYTANAAYGTTATAVGAGFVVFNGNTDNVLVSNLISGNTYHYAIVEYDCTPENYNTAVYLAGTFTTTACSEPITAASNLIFSNVQQTQMDLSWTNGSGEKRIVVAIENASISAAETPVDAAVYAANAAFGTPAAALGSGFVVYNGTGNAVTVTGLTHSKTYKFAVFEFNCVPENYKTDVFVSATQATAVCPEPVSPATSLLTPVVKDDRIDLSWTNGAGAGRIVLVKAGAPLTAADYPVNNTSYTFGNNIGGAFVAYIGTYSTASVGNLAANTTYYFGVFEYSCDPKQYLTTSFATANATTLPPALVRYSFIGAAGNEATFAADAQPANATGSVMSRSTISPSASTEAFGGSGFPTATINAASYYSFTLTPATNYDLTLTKLELDERRSATGIRSWSVRSSIDGFVSDLAVFNVPDDTNERIDNEILLNNAFQNLTSAVEFRIYGYSAEATGGTWKIDNVQAFGTVTQLPPPVVTTLQVSKTAETVLENAGTISVDVLIAGESATVPTSVDVVLLTGNVADVNNYTTQTITFPAGSNASQTITFALTDNAVFQGTRLLTFGLQNATGGNQAATGLQNTFELTITDNELPEIYINEFHYNNAGTDVDEFVEVVVPHDFTELGNVTLTLYNGNDGSSYASYKLNTFVTNDQQYGNYKVYSLLIPAGIQNGSPDGFSLDYAGQLIEFISYGGTFAASNGPAMGATSVDVGFTETESDPVGTSIYLTQGGSPWIWAKQAGSNTMGLPNTNQPLPIELLSFKAVAKENAILLAWETASEKNSSHFEIERSTDARNFETIGSEKAQGNSQNLKRYAFTDQNPLSGMTYYRMKQVDLDGTVAYSKIEQVNLLEKQQPILYPNPATDKIYIKGLSDLSGIRILNALGQEVFADKDHTETGLDISHLPNGVYQVLITGKSKITRLKLVKASR